MAWTAPLLDHRGYLARRLVRRPRPVICSIRRGGPHAPQRKDSPSRVDAAKQAFADLGVEIRDIYWTLGAYDLVSVIEAPDDEAIIAAMLRLSSLGNVRTTTMRAFGRGEFESVVGKAG